VLSAAKAKEDEGWKDACRRELVKLQQGEQDNLELWKRFIDISIAEFGRMYGELGVKFDTYRGESFYNAMMPGVVERLLEMGLAKESEGALIVDLSAEKLAVAIVRKSDGGYNYTTSDLACVESRVAEYAPERIIYVTDDRQQLHFKQFFSIAAKMGHTAKLVHVPFGLMSYQGKAISTREGNLIKLDDLLAEAVRRSYDIVAPRGGDMQLARAIGYGAVKYADLSHDPATAIDFDWDKALALEGNSGPYLQYAFARVSSLMDKAGEFDKGGAFAVETPAEKRLALQLMEFPGAVVRAAEAYKPSILADYLFQTAQLYSSFYQNSPILKVEEPRRSARLRLCALFGEILKRGLGLLGIEAPKRI
jgi:arginyl-tRNA synthetase